MSSRFLALLNRSPSCIRRSTARNHLPPLVPFLGGCVCADNFSSAVALTFRWQQRHPSEGQLRTDCWSRLAEDFVVSRQKWPLKFAFQRCSQPQPAAQPSSHWCAACGIQTSCFPPSQDFLMLLSIVLFQGEVVHTCVLSNISAHSGEPHV